jgi:hypothetical protein
LGRLARATSDAECTGGKSTLSAGTSTSGAAGREPERAIGRPDRYAESDTIRDAERAIDSTARAGNPAVCFAVGGRISISIGRKAEDGKAGN